MNKKPDIDTSVIISLPMLLVLSFIILPEKAFLFSIGIVVGVFIYELITYNKRHFYGFSGLQILSPISLILFSFTIFIAVPSIYICFTKNNPAVYLYYFSIVIFYIIFPIGLLLGNKIWGINIGKVKHLLNGDFQKSKYDNFIYEIVILFITAGILVFLLYLIRVKTIPLLELIRNPGDYIRLMALRQEAYLLLPVTFIEKYLFLWERSIIMPIIIIGSISLYLINKQKKFLIIFLIFLSIGILFNSLTLEKSPTAAIILSLMALYYLRKKHIGVRFLFFSLFLIFLIPALILYFQHLGHYNMFRLVYISILDRIFITPTEVLYHHFEIFPRVHDFLDGRSTHLFSWLYNDGTFPLSNYVAKVWWKNPKTTLIANVIFIGNFWADFGFLGVITSSFFVGLIGHWYFWKILSVSNYSKNIIYIIVVTISVPIFTFVFMGSNFTTIFFSRGVLVLIILLFVIEGFKKKTLVN